MKHLRNLLVLAVFASIWSAENSFACTPVSPVLSKARLGGCGRPINIPGFPSLLPGRKPKILPDIFPGLVKPQTQFLFVDTEVMFSVSFRSQNPNPPSCKVVAGRLKNHAARISEMSHLTSKIDQGQSLGFQEIRDLIKMTRMYVPQVLDEVDQKVEMNVTWKFLNFLPRNEPGIFYFLRNQPYNFDDFLIEGPGLRWESAEGELPPFFDLLIDDGVSVAYEMEMLDLCFGSNTIRVQGRLAEELGPEDPVLLAWWERDILKLNQMDFWTIKTVRQLTNEAASKDRF